MPLLFLAFIGLSLLTLFLFKLSKLPASVVILSVKWTSLTILLTAFVLFVLSGRTLPATLLVLAVSIPWILRRKWTPAPPKQISWNTPKKSSE